MTEVSLPVGWIGRNVRTAGAAVLLVALVAAPFVVGIYYAEIVVTGLVFVMLATSWNLLGGYTGQISLGHAAFFGLGAYISAWLTSPAVAGFPAWIALPPVVAILVGGVAMAVISIFLGPFFFRLRGHYFAVGTLALAAIVQILMNTSASISGGATGYSLNNGDPFVAYFYALLATIACLATTYHVVGSKSGIGMRAVKGDESAASSLGVNPLRYKIYAFVYASFWAGIAGGVYAQYTLYINPQSTLAVGWTVNTLVIVILGGIGTLLGPIVGSVLFLVLDNLLQNWVGGLSVTIEGVLIMLFILVLPYGVYGYYRERFVPD